jgi:hypothetical protein
LCLSKKVYIFVLILSAVSKALNHVICLIAIFTGFHASRHDPERASGNARSGPRPCDIALGQVSDPLFLVRNASVKPHASRRCALPSTGSCLSSRSAGTQLERRRSLLAVHDRGDGAAVSAILGLADTPDAPGVLADGDASPGVAASICCHASKRAPRFLGEPKPRLLDNLIKPGNGELSEICKPWR